MTTQPAGEHHTGSLDLTGEGNAPASPISDAMADLATDALAIGVHCPPNCNFQAHSRAEMRAVLESAYPAIRQQVAEEIAGAIAARRAEITEGRPGWVYLTEAIGIAKRGLL